MNTVLESTRPVIQYPTFVHINYDAINSLASKLCNEKFEIPRWNDPVFIQGDDNDVIDYFVLGNTINFAFTDFKTKEKYIHEYDNTPFRGAFGMFAALKDAIDNGYPLLEGAYLKDISENDMRKIFNNIPMFDERLKIFREVGDILTNKYDGHFYNVIPDDKRLFNYGNGLVELLRNDFHSFDDFAYFNGEIIRFDKRAQLAAAGIYGRFQDQKIFPDVDELTVFADYELPRALRQFKILNYEESLANTIDTRQLIESECLEELELRASTIHAADYLIKKINSQREDKINALHIDYYLWREAKKSDKPHHLTRTIAY